MAHRFACDHSERVKAIACVAGSKNYTNVHPTAPVSVMIIHGTDDEHTPYHGGEGTQTVFKREDLSVEETIQFWVKVNACEMKPEMTHDTALDKEWYKHGKNDTEVIAYTIHGQGHAWPGGKPGRRYGNVDEPSTALNASEVIWSFFKQHGLDA